MISNTSIANTNTDILTVPAGESYASVAVILCNYGASDETINIYAVPSAGSAGNSNIIMKAFLLPSTNTYVFDTKLLMGAGDKLVAIGTTGSLVTATVTYISIA